MKEYKKLNEFEIIRIAVFVIFTVYSIFKICIGAFTATADHLAILLLSMMLISLTNDKVNDRKWWEPFLLCFFLVYFLSALMPIALSFD